jgi:hypothetical protein
MNATTWDLELELVAMRNGIIFFKKKLHFYRALVLLAFLEAPLDYLIQQKCSPMGFRYAVS